MEKTITHLSPFTQTATKLFFKPATTGLIQGTLMATNNSENEASAIITLSGTGLEPPVFKYSYNEPELRRCSNRY